MRDAVIVGMRTASTTRCARPNSWSAAGLEAQLGKFVQKDLGQRAYDEKQGLKLDKQEVENVGKYLGRRGTTRIPLVLGVMTTSSKRRGRARWTSPTAPCPP